MIFMLFLSLAGLWLQKATKLVQKEALDRYSPVNIDSLEKTLQ